jgi:hypothetical protein
MKAFGWLTPLANNDYRKALILAHLGWWSTAAIVIMRPLGLIPMQYGSVAVLTLGFAVAASLALSRMRLGKTISQVFQTGMTLAVNLTETNGTGGSTGCAVIRTDLSGQIKSCERVEVIGWPEEQAPRLEGRTMDSLIPDRFMSINHAALTQYREASAGGTDEAGVIIAFNVPIRGYDGVERGFRMTITRLGDTLIKTLIPISDNLSLNSPS